MIYVIRNPLNTKKKETPIPPPFLKKLNTGNAVIGRCNKKTFRNAAKRSASNVLKCLLISWIEYMA